MKFRTLLLGLSALFVAFNAAFFSVTGLSKLFAGAATSVIIMASSLEFAKLIVAGYLYNYWDNINKVLRTYLIIGTLILVLITSLGIYGFLTAAFQDTLNVYNVTNKNKIFLQQKESFWNDDVARYDREMESINQRIEQLSSAKATQIQIKDKDGKLRNTVSTTEIRLAQSRLTIEEQNRKDIQSKRQVVTDSLQSIQLKILAIDTDTESSSELGPLQYLSTLLDKPMTDIINWFILIIIFVFDPLAVTLVIAFNNALKVDKGKADKTNVIQKRKLYGESDLEEQVEDMKKVVDSYDDLQSEIGEWDNTLQDGLNDYPNENDDIINDDSDSKLDDVLYEPNDELKESVEEYNQTLINDIEVIDTIIVTDDKSYLDLDGDGVITDKERVSDLDGDGVISEEEKREWYENGGWKSTFDGRSYFYHPWFDWGKKERWINDRAAINHWINYRGGSRSTLKKLQSNQYPDDFTSKTY